MKYTILKYGMLAGTLLLGGCNNWLDVDPNTIMRRQIRKPALMVFGKEIIMR